MNWRSALKADLARHSRRDVLSIVTLTLIRLNQGVSDPSFGPSRFIVGPFVKLAKFVWCELCMSAQFPTSTEIGPGLRLPHGGRGVMIYPLTKIGSNCTIFQWATIGAIEVIDDDNFEQWEWAAFPTIGDNVYIGCGAQIFGNVHVGDRARIGFGAVVVKDVPADATVKPVPGEMVLRRRTVADPDVASGERA